MRKGVLMCFLALSLLGILCMIPHAMNYFDEKLCYFVFTAAIVSFLIIMIRYKKK